MYGVVYNGNGGGLIFRIGFADRDDAERWMRENCDDESRCAYVMSAHMASLNGLTLLIWHGAE